MEENMVTRLLIVAGLLGSIFIGNVSAREVSTQSINVIATAYCITGKTATGTYTHRGTIAVDPNVIPLWSKVFVPHYGLGVALDTGSAVLGYHIDLWFPTCKAADNWGARYITIMIYSKKGY